MLNRTNSTLADLTRRTFLRRAAGGAMAACCVPAIVPSSVLGAAAPSNRINVGFIGLGNQSKIDLPAFLDHDDAQVVAVCDVNRGSTGYLRDDFLGREPAQKNVNEYYAKKTGVGQYNGCDAYVDFREVLGRSDIQAVVLIVPDHWHGVMTAMAAKAHKDIYCEKPLSLTFRQGQEMIKAVRENQRVFQTGSMYRSSPTVRFACELVRNERIGQLKRIVTVVPGIPTGPGPGWQPKPVPDGFDYEMWLGPAPKAAYHSSRCLYRFRFISDYSGGQITNTGAHLYDIAQWGNGTELSGPVEFENQGAEWPEKGSLYDVATKTAVVARYANGVELVCETIPRGGSIRFEGSEGSVEYSLNKFETTPASLKDTKIGPNEIHLAVSNKNRVENELKYFGLDHARNFLDCVKSRDDAINPVEIGHRTATICHLGNIAMKLARKIRWDPEKEQITGDDEAAAMLSRPLRAPWTI